MPIFRASTTTELMSALKKASAGDTILLEPGSYGDVSLRKLVFDSPVTIKSADPANPATFKTLTLNAVHGVTFDSIRVDFEPNAQTMAWSSAVRITASSNVGIVNSVIEGGPAVNGVPPSTEAGGLDATGNVLGLPAGRAISVSTSNAIKIENNDISVFHKGIVLSDVKGMVIRGNEIHDLRTTPLSGGNVSDILVEKNYFHDSNPWRFGGAGDHGDFLHFWTVPTKQTGPSTGIDIRDNFFDQGAGTALLGIYLDDNYSGVGFAKVNISGNTLFNGNHQGIRLENVREGTVTANVLLQSSGTEKQGPTLILVGDSSNLKVTNNIFSGKAAPTLQPDENGNYTVQRHDPTAENYSGDLFVNPFAPAGVADLQVREGSLLARRMAGEEERDFSADATLDRSGNDRIDGSTGNDRLSGEGGDDVLAGLAGDDLLDGGSGSDTADYSGNWGNFTIDLNLETAQDTGATGSDTLVSIENVIGGRGANKLYGNDAANLLDGGAGTDLLYAGGGDDILIGGLGKDVMKGGSGSDRFVFQTAADSAVGSGRDVIHDFTSGADSIDLSAIDANSLIAGDQAFTFIGSASFTKKAGELRSYSSSAGTMVAGDLNGDGIADFEIALVNKAIPAAADFIL